MQNRQLSTTQVNLIVDLVIFMAFLLVMVPNLPVWRFMNG